MKRSNLYPSAAFTLVELLVVISILSTLIGLLIPVIGSAIGKARLTQCASNERQLCIALYNYAGDNKGKFPPCTTSIAIGDWYDANRIGLYLKPSGVPTGQPGGPVYTCPSDDYNAHLSYGMNVWASSRADASVTTWTPPAGTMWSAGGHAPLSRLILLTEAYSGFGNATQGWFAEDTFGFAGQTAGAKFGGGAGIAPPLSQGRFGKVVSQVCYMRHRPGKSPYQYTQPHGIVNIAYGDSHVETKVDTELVTPSGNSSGDSLWCATDVIGP